MTKKPKDDTARKSPPPPDKTNDPSLNTSMDDGELADPADYEKLTGAPRPDEWLVIPLSQPRGRK